MSNEIEIAGETVPKQPTPVQRFEAEPADFDMERIQLLTRLAIGASLEGGEYLLAHLRRYQTVVDELATKDPRANINTASHDDLIGYLAVGAFVRTQRSSLRLAAKGVRLSFDAVQRSTSILDRLTDNPLGRPLRRPVIHLADRLAYEINESVRVGHRESVDGSILVREAALDIVDEFIAYISKSPELADLVQDQIGQQSVGMATAIAETGRGITGHADRTIEDKIRSWLGLDPREEMPRSPFTDKPKTVHHPGLKPMDGVPPNSDGQS